MAYRHYFDLLRALACSVFKWEGLPDEIDERYIEFTLVTMGLCVFFRDEDFDAYLALQATPERGVNVYRNPVGFRAYGPQYSKSLTYKKGKPDTECVPIWANPLRQPMISSLELYARKLADMDRTVTVNLAAQKTPVLITCPETVRLTMENLYKQYAGNEPAIFGTPMIADLLASGAIQVFKTDAPYIADKVMLDKAKIWAEIMTFLGIDNANQDKKERLVADEVSANNGQIEMARLVGLNARRMACKEINKRWGLNVSVNFNVDSESANAEFAADDRAKAELAAQITTVTISGDEGEDEGVS